LRNRKSRGRVEREKEEESKKRTHAESAEERSKMRRLREEVRVEDYGVS